MNYEHQADKLLEAERAMATAAVKYCSLAGMLTRAARPCKMYGKYSVTDNKKYSD